MELWTEAITPAELSVYARKTMADVEKTRGTLSTFFPAKVISDNVARYTRTDNGLEEAAEYRAFDAESSIGGSNSGERVTLELPPISRKNRIGELDQIRAYAAPDNDLKITIAKETDRVINAVSERLEYMRGKVLETGKIDINSNGFRVSAKLGRDSSMEATAATKWDQNGSIIDDLSKWVEAYVDKNGEAPAVILGSMKLRSVMQRDSGIQKMIKGASNQALVTVEELNALLAAHDLPRFVTYDRKIKSDGKIARVIDHKKLILLPEAGTEKLGNTIFGRTAEAGDPDYGFVASDMPGLVASAHRTYDPYAHWVRANAIALPVMTNPNAAMVAEVLSA